MIVMILPVLLAVKSKSKVAATFIIISWIIPNIMWALPHIDVEEEIPWILPVVAILQIISALFSLVIIRRLQKESSQSLMRVLLIELRDVAKSWDK